MTDYDAIVIGAGNGGLTASLTMAKAGLKTLLLERHNIPGGCATSFIRGRFEFEVALHQLSGIGTVDFPGPLIKTFSDLDVLDDIEFVEMKNLYRVVYPGKMDLVLKADRAESIKTLQEHFPNDADQIARFYDFVWEYCNQWIHVVLMKDAEASAQKYPVFFKYALKSMQEVLNEYFTDPLLLSAIGMYYAYLGLPPRLSPFGEFALVLWGYTEFKPWHIKGGSQALSNALLNKFLEHGGTVRFNCSAIKINVQDETVTGVITEDGDEVSTKRIISNAGTYNTYIDLIDSEQVPSQKYKELAGKSVGVSGFTIFIGFDEEPDKLGIREATNFLTMDADANKAYDYSKTLLPAKNMLFTCYDVDDPQFSPVGCCQGALICLAYGEPWLKVPPARYFERKYEFARHMLTILYKVFPKCENHIEEIEVATPLTHMRYLGHPGGAIYGFDHLGKDTDFFIEKASPIKGLFHAGAWMGSGGFQPTLMSGASAGRALIKSLKN